MGRKQCQEWKRPSRARHLEAFHDTAAYCQTHHAIIGAASDRGAVQSRDGTLTRSAQRMSTTSRECRCTITLRLTRCNALSTVLGVQPSRPAISSYERPSRYIVSTPLSSVESVSPRQPISDRSSSDEIAWLMGSHAGSSGRISARSEERR